VYNSPDNSPDKAALGDWLSHMKST